MLEDLRLFLSSLLPDGEPWRSLARAAIVSSAGVPLIVFLEKLYGDDLARYRSRNFANDFIYFLFYQGGLYNVLIYIPIFSILQPRLSFMKVDLLGSLPPAAAFVVYWIAADFCVYWLHRLQHRNRFLWAFHAVHHSQERLTFATSNRVHPIEQLTTNVMMMVPVLVLGIPQKIWVPFYLFHVILEGLQHTSLVWRFGPLYRIFVSPTFHHLHHSVEPREYNGNYSKIFSFWDFVFGTAVHPAGRALAYGIHGLRMPETITGTLIAPFKMLAATPTPDRELPAVKA